MNPHEADMFVTQIEDLFPGVPPTHRTFMAGMLEKYSPEIVGAAISRLATETSTFDRGRLRTLLQDEYGRRKPRNSPTPQWMADSAAEKKEIAAALDKLTYADRESIRNRFLEKWPQYSQFAKHDPLTTDFGRALIFKMLKEEGFN